MPEAVTPKVTAEIPQSYIEFTLVFERPALSLAERGDSIIEHALGALAEHGFTLDGVEAKLSSDKPSEHGIVFRRARPQLNIGVSCERIVVSSENPDWESAPKLIKAISAGLAAITETLRPAVKTQNFALGMHVQITGEKRRADVVRPLVTEVGTNLLGSPPDFTGVVLIGGGLTIIIEPSVQFANALWVRIIRDHAPDTTLEVIATTLRADEERLFNELQLEGVL
jgi:hypothetical protein